VPTPYSKQVWQDNVTWVDKLHMDHMEDGIANADASLTYLGDYSAATTYNNGDVVVAADGFAYVCVKDGVTAAPVPFPGYGASIPVPVQNGKWLKGQGGAIVWEAPNVANGIAGLDANAQVPAAQLGNAAMVKIQDINLSGTQATIDFTSIPQTYLSLQLRMFLRCDAAVANTTVAVRFNNNVSAVYNHIMMQVTAAGTTINSAEDTTPATFGSFSLCTGSTAAAGFYIQAVSDIVNYAANGVTHNWVTAAHGLWVNGTNGHVIRYQGGVCQDGTPINRITLLPSPSGNFVAGSRATLYGLN